MYYIFIFFKYKNFNKLINLIYKNKKKEIN